MSLQLLLGRPASCLSPLERSCLCSQKIMIDLSQFELVITFDTNATRPVHDIFPFSKHSYFAVLTPLLLPSLKIMKSKVIKDKAPCRVVPMTMILICMHKEEEITDLGSSVSSVVIGNFMYQLDWATGGPDI